MNGLTFLYHVVTHPWAILVIAVVSALIFFRKYTKRADRFAITKFTEDKPNPIHLIIAILSICVAGWMFFVLVVVPAIGSMFNAIF